MKPIEGILATHGIVPVLDYQDKELEVCYDPQDRQATLKHFNPRFPAAEPSLEAASAMFGTFVFRKLANAPPPARLPEGGMPEVGNGGSDAPISEEETGGPPGAKRRK